MSFHQVAVVLSLEIQTSGGDFMMGMEEIKGRNILDPLNWPNSFSLNWDLRLFGAWIIFKINIPQMMVFHIVIY